MDNVIKVDRPFKGSHLIKIEIEYTESDERDFTKLFPKDPGELKWVDRGDYKELMAPQMSQIWFDEHVAKICGSDISGTIGMSRFNTPEDTAKKVLTITPYVFSKHTKKLMYHGIKTEEDAKKFYIDYMKKKFNQDIEITDRGLCIPTVKNVTIGTNYLEWIGASVDGDIVGTDGMVEIKCPLKMHYPLAKYGEDESPVYDSNYHHIYRNYYMQMQICMKVLNKKWCDFIVYCTPEKRAFIQRIYFNESVWESEVVPKLTSFINNILIPMKNGTYISKVIEMDEIEDI